MTDGSVGRPRISGGRLSDMSDTVAPRAEFTAMTEGTRLDWQRIAEAQLEFYGGLADRVIDSPAAARRRLRRVRRRPAHALAADRDARLPRRPRRRVRRRARCSTTSATRSARSTTPTSPPRSSSRSSARRTTGWSSSTAIFQGYYFFHHLGLDREHARQFRGPPVLRPHRGVLRRLRQPAFDPRLPDDAARGVRAVAARAVRHPKQSIYLSDTNGATP